MKNKICAVSGLVLAFVLGMFVTNQSKENAEEELARVQQEADARLVRVLAQTRANELKSFVMGQLHEKWGRIGVEASHRFASGNGSLVVDRCRPAMLLLGGIVTRETGDLYRDLGLEALHLEVPQDSLGQFCVTEAKRAIWQILPVSYDSPYLGLWYTLQDSWAYTSYSGIEVR